MSKILCFTRGDNMKKINVTIFCDEVKNIKCSANEISEYQCWDYIGVLIVPTANIKELSYELNSKRCPNKDYNSCKDNCVFHNKNAIKLHYQDYSDTINYQIADRWCDTILNNTRYNRRFYTHVLGINTAKIDRKYFKNSGEETNVENNIYNRFFRTAIIYPLKTFFADYDEVVIDNIYHDCGDMDHHQYFKRQPLRKIYEEVKNVRLNCSEIITLNTNNCNCMEDSNTLLQLIDLYLGAVMNCIHHTGKKNKEKIALKLYPVVERCVNNPGNSNSKYFRVNSISFYPRHSISPSDGYIDKMIKRYENFYSNRELKIQSKNQLSIFDYV